MVRVADSRGKFLGTALYSSSSQIAIRMIGGNNAEITDLPAFVSERIRAAIAYRKQAVSGSDAYRVVFSEADFLPGLIIDRYNDVVSVQILTQAMDTGPIRGAIIATLVEELHPAGIVERVDPRIRELEQLPVRESGMMWGRKSASIITMNVESSAAEAADEGAASTVALKRCAAQKQALTTTGEGASEGAPQGLKPSSKTRTIGTAEAVPFPDFAKTASGVRFYYDALEGQKTGAFLDQRENYAAATRYARGDALDIFCYQGGFALHLAAECASVTGVDTSRPALELAEKNAALNFPGREFEWIEANAFDLLRDYAAAGRRYDAIVLDPPAFARTKRDLPKALSGYKELNLRALKMLAPGGILVTCSCSFHVGAADFLEIVAGAARDAHKFLRLLESRGAAKDHPLLINVPETGYLKCLVFHVSN